LRRRDGAAMSSPLELVERSFWEQVMQIAILNGPVSTVSFRLLQDLQISFWPVKAKPSTS
jgi:hypothetical protein